MSQNRDGKCVLTAKAQQFVGNTFSPSIVGGNILIIDDHSNLDLLVVESGKGVLEAEST